MALCKDCLTLANQAAHVKPHRNMVMAQSSQHQAYGLANGAVETYICRICSAQFSRDMEPNSSKAIWWVIKSS